MSRRGGGHWIAAVLVLLLAVSGAARAEDLMMVRSPQAFPEAMLSLQDAINAQGYTVSRVQRVDVGLTASGFKTDLYRVVFFGKPAQVRELARRYPDLIPYLPLKIAIFAEGKETILVAANPVEFEQFYAKEPALKPVFETWARDMRAILRQVRTAP